jgi:putative transposase
MLRMARVAVEGVPYHITQRGNAKQRIFFADSDYRMYLDLLRRHAERYGLDIWAYCLMPNHVHLIGVPRRPGSMARALGRTHAEYAQYFNLIRQSCGHVWQARYFSCPLDGAHLWRAMAYVERNPVRGGLARDASAYRWSSAAAHFGKPDPAGMVDLSVWRQEYTHEYTPERWREVLQNSVGDQELAERIREATVRGRPLGAAEFVEDMERRAGRSLRPMTPGRPRKARESDHDLRETPQLVLEIGN